MKTTIECLSTRLFPKNQGASAYQITGIASRCDWVVLSDTKKPQVTLHKNIATGSPRHIFLSLRDPFIAIRHFVERVLPTILEPFILISGSEDVTVPQQIDKRWRSYNAEEQGLIAHLLNHPLLSVWFAENLQDGSHHKFRPFPLGMVFINNQSHEITVPEVMPLHARPLRILCAHRVRPGPQWKMRRQVTKLAQTDWAKWCTVLEEEVNEERFLELMEQHSFVLCVDGGGIDPSPKAWQATLHGAIPIIRETPLQKAYEKLPVVMLPAWQSQHITGDFLRQWVVTTGVKQLQTGGRKITLERLGIDYWWDQISSCVPND